MGILDRLFIPNVEELVKRGDIKGLVKALQISRGDTDKKASNALINMGEASLEELFKQLLKGSRDKEFFNEAGAWQVINEEVLRTFKAVGEPAVGFLIQALKREKWQVRQTAATALAVIGDVHAVEPLILALKDESPHVRRMVAKALDNIDDVRAVGPLIEALSKEDYAVVAGAYAFFILRGEPGTEDALIRALRKHGNRPMAECLINCGNERLAKASLGWVSSPLRSYTLRTAEDRSVRRIMWGGHRFTAK